MTLTKKRQELPVFGDMMMNLFDDRFFEPVRKFAPRKLPSVNIFENKEAFNIQLATPGMKKEDFKIDLKNNTLTIAANEKEESEKEEGKYSIREFNYNTFKRAFTLPKNVDQSKIEARYTDGILEISIAKKEKEAAETKEITIS